MGLVGLEPTTSRLKARYSTIELQTHHNIRINIQLSRFGVVSLDHLFRIPPFDLWGEVGGRLGDCHRQQKKGRKLLVSLPCLFAFMDYILHMLIHIHKQGSTLNMPIAAIEITKLFCGHRVRHCFRPKCFYL
jgi:hypothetical protein